MMSNEKKLADTLIGEAVLSIIQSKRPINSKALLYELNNMLSTEIDVTRMHALQKAINEIDALNSSNDAISPVQVRNIKKRRHDDNDILIHSNKNKSSKIH
ncbi:hypothetical protein [Kluyvera genomosp. 1]|uniref:hypothetical protein n=1 Tax=Kluyvera genomosp. 1 TaxID=2774053 RepID=UPI00068A6C87|nr:hypothetical protein [Kluyvera genomosp. 1]